MIGKKIYNKRTNEEFDVEFVETIDSTTIVYTTDSKSFSLNDIELTPFQKIVDEFGKEEVVRLIKTCAKGIPEDEFKLLIEQSKTKSKKPKSKSINIFGWTISFSKSK
jgi:hypothetical protein